MPVRRPQLQLGVPGRPQPDQVTVAARDDVERGDDLAVAAIEPFGQPQHRRQRPNGAPQRALEHTVSVMRLFRRRLSMISRQQGDDLDLLRIEAAQLAVLD